MFSRTLAAPSVTRKMLGTVSDAVAAAPFHAQLAQAVAAFNPKQHAVSSVSFDSEFEWGDMRGASIAPPRRSQFDSAINASLETVFGCTQHNFDAFQTTCSLD